MLRIIRVMLLLSLTLGFSQSLIFSQEHAHETPEANILEVNFFKVKELERRGE
ncbi:MAG: hypothetical protein Q8R31_01240 [Candidatus Omnitrophota bacterium]|nr:hypothetical protein [Candidatus Omnitrophota bacterium]